MYELQFAFFIVAGNVCIMRRHKYSICLKHNADHCICVCPGFSLGFWFGVELEQPTGKHDGSVFGVRYFSCLPKYGVFAPPSRVQR